MNTGNEKTSGVQFGQAAMGTAAQRSSVVRMNLFLLVRILFQYLERVDPSTLTLAKEVLKDCGRKHHTQDSKYETLADAIHERVRDAVGESHWTQARKIQKQLVINQQMKKLKAMKDHTEKTASNRGNRKNMSSPSSQSPSQSQPSAEAIEAAEAMSALSRVAPNRTDTATPTRSNNTRDKKVGVSIDEKKDYDINHKPTIHDPGSTRKQN